jgi:hypothetical protein
VRNTAKAVVVLDEIQNLLEMAYCLIAISKAQVDLSEGQIRGDAGTDVATRGGYFQRAICESNGFD